MKLTFIISATIIFCFILLLCCVMQVWSDEIGEATWYSTKESKGVMANGDKLYDKRFTCASWNYDFGSILNVRNTQTGNMVTVRVADRGPGQPKCSCLKGQQRVIDLSKASFKKLAPLRKGIISVEINVIE